MKEVNVMKKTKPNKRQECFDLFEAYPNASTILIAKRSGIGESTLYRYRKEWNELAKQNKGKKVQKGLDVSNAVTRSCKDKIQAATVIGFALGSAFTFFVTKL